MGVTMLGLVIGWLTPAGGPLVIAVDDTLFRRTGRHVHAAFWAYDGSRRVAAGQEKLSRGNTFVVAAVVVDLRFFQGRPQRSLAQASWLSDGTAMIRETRRSYQPCHA